MRQFIRAALPFLSYRRRPVSTAGMDPGLPHGASPWAEGPRDGDKGGSNDRPTLQIGTFDYPKRPDRPRPPKRATLRPTGPREPAIAGRSEEHTSELQSRGHLVCRLLLEKNKKSAVRQSQSSENKKKYKIHQQSNSS